MLVGNLDLEILVGALDLEKHKSVPEEKSKIK